MRKKCQEATGCSVQKTRIAPRGCFGKVQFRITEAPLWITDPVLIRLREKYAIPDHWPYGWHVPASACIFPCDDCQTPSAEPRTEHAQDTGDSVSYRVARQVMQYRTYPKGESYPVCPRCNADIDREYMRFCDRCGQRLSWDHFPDW